MKQNKYNPDIAFHPRETLAEKIFEMGLSVQEFADQIKKPFNEVNNVINGFGDFTEEFAVLCEQITKIPKTFWLNKQAAYYRINEPNAFNMYKKLKYYANLNNDLNNLMD